MMSIENMTNTWLSQMGDPACSMLAGAMMGQLMTYRYVIFLLLFGALITIISKVVSDIYNWIKIGIIKYFQQKRTFKRKAKQEQT